MSALCSRIYRNWVGALPGRWGNLARFRLPPSFNHTPTLLCFRLNSYQGFLADKGLATTSTVPEDNRSSNLMTVGHFMCSIFLFHQSYQYFFRPERNSSDHAHHQSLRKIQGSFITFWEHQSQVIIHVVFSLLPTFEVMIKMLGGTHHWLLCRNTFKRKCHYLIREFL